MQICSSPGNRDSKLILPTMVGGYIFLILKTKKHKKYKPGLQLVDNIIHVSDEKQYRIVFHRRYISNHNPSLVKNTFLPICSPSFTFLMSLFTEFYILYSLTNYNSCSFIVLSLLYKEIYG